MSTFYLIFGYICICVDTGTQWRVLAVETAIQAHATAMEERAYVRLASMETIASQVSRRILRIVLFPMTLNDFRRHSFILICILSVLPVL